jgi:serine phosphatase RsbU (regulator of sigma subunit)
MVDPGTYHAAMVSARYPRAAFVAGLGLVTLLVLVDLLAPFSFLGAFGIGVFVAAVAAPPRRVALVGAYAIAWAALLGFEGEWWTGPHWLRVALVVAATGAAVLAADIRERYVEALVRTANVAEVAQRALLRPLEDRYDGVDISCRYLSASAGAQIGGDVYDVEVTSWGLRVLVADVSGHGLDAVDMASSLVSAFRENAHRSPTLRELTAAMDESFERVIAGRPDFATAVLVQIDDGRVEVVNCGHPDPLLVGSQGARWLRPVRRSRPIGMHPDPASMHLVLVGRDCLVLYTDGLTEASPAGGRVPFDLEQRAMAAFGRPELDDALDALLRELTAHTRGNLRDDVVVLAVRPA